MARYAEMYNKLPLIPLQNLSKNVADMPYLKPLLCVLRVCSRFLMS